MQVTALLPMKGNSERVPNKNMKSFCGKPLYHAIVKSLMECSYIKNVIINTDSEIIKNDALKHFGDYIIIHDRPLEICGDLVSMNEIIKYDIQQHKGQHYLQTHSTNPLIKPATFKEAIEKYFHQLETYDSVFSVTRLQTRLYWEDGSAINHNPAELLRTQDLPPVFEENSNFFLFSQESFFNAGEKRIGKSPSMFSMNKIEAIDIDYPEDFELAEIIYTKSINE